MAAPKPRSDLRAETTAARLAALDLPQGGFTAPARADALDRLRAMGLPTRRDEYWKYTDPSTLTAAEAVPAAVLVDEEAPVFEAIERLKIVFVDGVFDASASDDLSLEGLEISRLAEAGDIHWAKGLYGTLEAKGQVPVARPLAALNSAAATDGVLIRVTGRVSKPLELIYRHMSEVSDAILHHFVKIDPQADITILESGPGASRFNTVMEVDLGAKASFHHIRVQGRDHHRRAVTHVFARIASEATFKSFTLTMNGALTRNEAVLDIVGDHAIAHVAGASVGDAKTVPFHQDDTVFVTHAGTHCESRQVFKKVLKNGATGVFQGKILVKPGAQKTDGYQISQSLLLDGDSQFLAKPELEIYADDVKCSHGSTSGAIDDTALFYLRSRGVPLAEAQALLVLSFLGDAIAEIEDEGIAEAITARLEAWLGRRL